MTPDQWLTQVTNAARICQHARSHEEAVNTLELLGLMTPRPFEEAA